MSTFHAYLPNETLRVEAADLASAKVALRQRLGVKRLPNGAIIEAALAADQDAVKGGFPPVRMVIETQYEGDLPLPTEVELEQAGAVISETDFSRPLANAKTSWRDLQGEELAEYLLENVTITDKTWTGETRLKGEKRSDFIRRVLASA